MSESMFMAAALHPSNSTSPAFPPPPTSTALTFKANNNFPTLSATVEPQKHAALPDTLLNSTRKNQVLQFIRTTPFNYLSETNFHHTVPALTSKTRGKVHISVFDPSPIYLLINTNEWKLETYDNGEYLVLVTTVDRVINSIPFKGQVLNQTSLWWFERTQHITANAVVSTPDPNVIIARNVLFFY
ncbi:hypothetical protein Ahy_B01g055937 [Arachis hypogaea]|uniref:phosphoribosylaminoimidazolesuccinocarboxamide synthase n=1 Tax=Arachis hypogaea TaxID=3818 RepID=A0A445AXH9_ARAHY|nr:hypothetical protein Ahy_B01g055937 [Arachis hypogaea]